MSTTASTAHITAAGKRWARLIPVAFITYSFAYVDRANFSFGAAGGQAQDLDLGGNLTAFLSATFFLGYFLFQIPGAHYAEHRSARRLIFWSLILWGALAAATGFVSNVVLLFLVRFLLGVVESAVLPGMLILLSHWFTREERSRANSFLILGNPITVLWMSVVSGYLVHAFGWRGMFVAEGLPAVIWAFIWLPLVRDRPEQAAWLSADEKRALAARLEQEQRGLPAVGSYREAFRLPEVLLLSAQYLLWSVGIYGFILWLPSMLKAGSSIGIIETGWLSAAPYLLAAVLMVLASTASDRLLNRRAFVWPFLLVGAAALYGSYVVGTGNFWLSYGLLVIAGGAMYAPYGPFFAWISELLPRNVSGAAIALINSCGALGSFIGTYIVGFLNAATGGNGASYVFMAGALVLATLLTLAVRGRARRQEALAR
jgi:sugar phosphate permease